MWLQRWPHSYIYLVLQKVLKYLFLGWKINTLEQRHHLDIMIVMEGRGEDWSLCWTAQLSRPSQWIFWNKAELLKLLITIIVVVTWWLLTTYTLIKKDEKLFSFPTSAQRCYFTYRQLTGSTVILGCSVSSTSEESPFETALKQTRKDNSTCVQFRGLSICTPFGLT